MSRIRLRPTPGTPPRHMAQSPRVARPARRVRRCLATSGTARPGHRCASTLSLPRRVMLLRAVSAVGPSVADRTHLHALLAPHQRIAQPRCARVWGERRGGPAVCLSVCSMSLGTALKIVRVLSSPPSLWQKCSEIGDSAWRMGNSTDVAGAWWPTEPTFVAIHYSRFGSRTVGPKPHNAASPCVSLIWVSSCSGRAMARKPIAQGRRPRLRRPAYGVTICIVAAAMAAAWGGGVLGWALAGRRRGARRPPRSHEISVGAGMPERRTEARAPLTPQD